MPLTPGVCFARLGSRVLIILQSWLDEPNTKWTILSVDRPTRSGIENATLFYHEISPQCAQWIDPDWISPEMTKQKGCQVKEPSDLKNRTTDKGDN
jgi:hypothetical protein